MANEESSKFSSNPKVPPLKIVFNSHHNNAVISSLNEDSAKFCEKDDNSNDQPELEEVVRRNSLEINDSNQKHNRKSSKLSIERNESNSGHTSNKAAAFSSSSSSTTTTTSTPDRSNSTTPSSESESLASTIILDNQNVKSAKNENSDHETVVSKQVPKCGFKVFSSEKISTNEPDTSGKKSQDNTVEQSNDSSNVSTKEQILNANQRITRSSQRAAQQIRTENQGELNGDDSIVSESQDKIHDSSRKVKRRKVEPQEIEQDGNQAITQPPVTMANICPSDYQLPPQNSFELYRDIRKRPYNKLMKLSHTQPKIPHGFKDYLLNGGPYLLDGNKLGVGLTGARLEHLRDAQQSANNGLISTSRAQLHMKLSNSQKLSPYNPSKQRHVSYTIPKLAEAPKNLQLGSPLYELFQDQEKARQQMRMQHLKERERSILASEQEILRAYNRAAIADMKQKFHLSACTYFYYQERYHYYLGEKSESNKNTSSKEVPHSQENSFLCIEGGEATKSIDNEHLSLLKESSTENATDTEQNVSKKNDGLKVDASGPPVETVAPVKKEKGLTSTAPDPGESEADFKSGDVQGDKSLANGKHTKSLDNQSSNLTNATPSATEVKGSSDNPIFKESNLDKSKSGTDNSNKCMDVDSDRAISETSNDKDSPTKSVTEDDLKVSNKEAFLNQLQEIDDKWDKIKKDMFVRHRNEADSLYAVQTLEWEWKAKEIGACDVRVSFKIEPEFVPRVEVSALDY